MAKYRAEKAAIGPSGGAPCDCPLYQKIHEILGNFRIENSHLYVEESLDCTPSKSSSSVSCLEPPPSSPEMAFGCTSPSSESLQSNCASPLPTHSVASAAKNAKNALSKLIKILTVFNSKYMC